MSHFRSIALALVLATALVPAASAQDASEAPVTEANGAIVLEALGHRFSLPRPSWLDAATPLEGNVETRFQTADGEALLEIFPKGESEAFWQTLYGVRLVADGPALTEFRSGVMAGYARNCKPEMVGFFQLDPDEGENLPPLGFVCGGYRDGLTGFSGKGAIMVMGFYKTPEGVGLLFQEWRGDAFDPTKPATWPVTTEVIEKRVAEFKSASALAIVD